MDRKRNPHGNLSIPGGFRFSSKLILIASLAVCIVLAAVIVHSFQNTTTTLSSNAAIVNGQTISLTALDQRFKLLSLTDPAFFDPEQSGVDEAEIKRAILDEMVEQTLIAQEAQRRGIEIDEKSISELIEIQVAAARENDDPNSGKLIAQYQSDSNRDLVRSRLMERTLISRLVSESEITEEEMQSYYEHHKTDAQTGKGLLPLSYLEERSRIISYLLDEKRAVQWTILVNRLKAEAGVEIAESFEHTPEVAIVPQGE